MSEFATLKKKEDTYKPKTKLRQFCKYWSARYLNALGQEHLVNDFADKYLNIFKKEGNRVVKLLLIVYKIHGDLIYFWRS